MVKHTRGRNTIFQMFLENSVLELSMLESADDITAAETAPSPITATAGGVKYCSTSGKTNLYSGISPSTRYGA